MHQSKAFIQRRKRFGILLFSRLPLGFGQFLLFRGFRLSLLRNVLFRFRLLLVLRQFFLRRRICFFLCLLRRSLCRRGTGNRRRCQRLYRKLWKIRSAFFKIGQNIFHKIVGKSDRPCGNLRQKLFRRAHILRRLPFFTISSRLILRPVFLFVHRLSLLYMRNALCQNCLNVVIAQRIIHGFSIFPALYQTRLLQKAELVGNRGLAHPQQRRNITNA